MKNYIQEGDDVEVTLDGTYASGDGFMKGKVFVVLAKSGVNLDVVNGGRIGVYSVKKLSTDVVTAGAKLNWNNTTKQFQLATSDLDGAATALEAQGAGVTLIKAVLTPV